MGKIVALYLDKLNIHMEKMLIERSVPEVDLRFLQPVSGKKGELADAEIVFDTLFEVTKEVIDQIPNLKLIQRTGVGVDMVDVAYAKEKGIPVSICKGFNSSSVAELAILGMLALYRKIVIMDETTKAGKWETWTYRHESYELTGKTVGIIGFGDIGRRVAKRVQAFEAKVAYFDVNRLPEEQEKELGAVFMPLQELVQTADIITVHVPLFSSTKGIIGEKELAAMKPTAILINTARGPLVDQDALLDALKNRKIAGAFLDVFDKMPTTADHPLFRANLDNLIVAPHIGAATYDNYDRVFNLCMENALRVLKGDAPLYTI